MIAVVTLSSKHSRRSVFVGALLALALPLLMYRIPRRLFRVCRPAALALIALGLWFTYSRGAWIGAALGVGAALWWLVRRGLDNRQPRRHRRRKRPWLWITVGITVGIALIATAGSLYEPGRAYYLETNNVSSRVTTYRFVWDQTVSSPARVAFGAGIDDRHDLRPRLPQGERGAVALVVRRQDDRPLGRQHRIVVDQPLRRAG